MLTYEMAYQPIKLNKRGKAKAGNHQFDTSLDHTLDCMYLRGRN